MAFVPCRRRVRVKGLEGSACSCCHHQQVSKGPVGIYGSSGRQGWPPLREHSADLTTASPHIASSIASTAESRNLQPLQRRPSPAVRRGAWAVVWIFGRPSALSRHLHEDGVAHADAPSSTPRSCVSRCIAHPGALASPRIQLVITAALPSKNTLSSKSHLTEHRQPPGARVAARHIEKGPV
jgi:hypothetical protein